MRLIDNRTNLIRGEFCSSSRLKFKGISSESTTPTQTKAKSKWRLLLHLNVKKQIKITTKLTHKNCREAVATKILSVVVLVDVQESHWYKGLDH